MNQTNKFITFYTSVKFTSSTNTYELIVDVIPL